ncbi:hypothetical protein MPSEU_000097600 [Mayamaea pseudoterrestris]|nr:hypothetical protein MPSEU_000097600 [Mayamaea pseudoterrestris]
MMFHPMNQVGTYKYDFMMFKIEPVENYEYKIMQLNGSPASPTEGEVLTVIGMGYTQEGGPSTEILNQVDVMAFSTSQCQASYGSSIIPEAMLCAGWPQGGKDSCNGDSGAPLFNSQGQQVGLTSFGSGCARAGKPGVYARISGAKDWIDQTICSLSSYPPSWCFAQQAPISTLTVNQPVAPPTQRPTPPPSRYPTLPPTLPPVPVATPIPTRYPTHPPIPVPVVPIPTPQPTVMFQQQGTARFSFQSQVSS